jgi:DNA repair protein RadC
MTPSQKPHYHGHRTRLRQRLLDGGAEALPDYELLELVLFLAQPRRDMKPLAKRLLDRFETFDAVITASPRELRAVEGAGDAVVAALKTR